MTQAQLIPLHLNPLLSAALCPQHPADSTGALGTQKRRDLQLKLPVLCMPVSDTMGTYGRNSETHSQTLYRKNKFLNPYPSAQMLVLPQPGGTRERLLWWRGSALPGPTLQPALLKLPGRVGQSLFTNRSQRQTQTHSPQPYLNSKTTGEQKHKDVLLFHL